MGWNRGSQDAPTGGDPWSAESSVTRLNPWLVVGFAAFVFVVAVGVLALVLTNRSTTDADAGHDATSAAGATQVGPDDTTSTSRTTPSKPPTTPAPTPAPTTLTTAPPPPTPTSVTTLPMSDAEAWFQMQQIVSDDRPRVDALVDQWVPQLSSKAVGLDVPDDGLGPYTLPMILSDHLGYKNRYEPTGTGVLLLHSEDYNFKTNGFWVTVAEVTFPTATAANGWCDAQRIGPKDCFAKKLSHTSGWQGSTLPRPGS